MITTHGFSLDKLIETGFSKSNTLLNGIDREFFADRIISQNNGKTYCELVPAHRELLHALNLNSLENALFKVAHAEFGYQGDIDNQYHIARHVVPGNTIEKFRTHFDSHLFTIVIPLRIPNKTEIEQDVGQLYFAPNYRKMPRNELVNIAQKMHGKRYANGDAIAKGLQEKVFLEEDFSDGCPLLFEGKTTLHGNKNVGVNADNSRLSVLANYFDDSGSLGLGGILRKLHPRRV